MVVLLGIAVVVRYISVTKMSFPFTLSVIDTNNLTISLFISIVDPSGIEA